MTDNEKATLIETEQRSKANAYRLDKIDAELREIQNDQKAIYKIATSVELIAQRVTTIEDKVDDTNAKVDAQIRAWNETGQKLTERVAETESKPYKDIAANVNAVKVAIITGICTLIACGIVSAVMAFGT
jgi:t-SNARE complex subunit (syntaxin)